MLRSARLERKLAEFRYRREAENPSSFIVLDEIGLSPHERTVLPFDEADRLARRYVEQLVAHSGQERAWPPEAGDEAQRLLDDMAERVDSLQAVWLPQLSALAVLVPAARLLRAATKGFVLRSEDLQLTSADGRDGISVELNHFSEGDQLNVTGWGMFALDRTQAGQASA